MSVPERVDVLVVGAGTAGAAAAACAAREGLSVLCLDRGPLARAGAHWVNGVSQAQFEEAGFDPPRGEELRGDDAGFHLIAGYGPERVTIRGHGKLEVDMRHLVARLQRIAREHGAALAGEVSLDGLDAGVARTSAGPVRADVVVDASGMTGARLLDQPRTDRRDLCTAAQAVHAVADPAGARAFLEAHEAAEGEALCFTGVAGGYSILNVSVHGDEVSILTGSIPAAGHMAGRAILDRFVDTHPWVGAKRFGGHRAIPLGRPHDEIARGPIALIGDAARQVFAAHGSGIGPQLLAARMLAEAIARGGGPEDYAVRWQRRYGGLFAGSDLFRRFSQTLTLDELRRLIRAELIDETTAGATLAQELPSLGVARALGMLPRLVEAGGVSARLARTGARMAAAHALYAAYPARGDRTRWSRAVTRVCG
ncbi:MAG TPA: FAD-binding protein [Sandaracinaceae bacterium LLY-WYZ-13_1]|nr:FAD-binding protein [Sandaracinaceae bacterium LLY-WYZ-13_1]